MYLKSFGRVKVFRRSFKNETYRYYIMYAPEKDTLSSISRTEFKEVHSVHWGIRLLAEVGKREMGLREKGLNFPYSFNL